MLPLGGIGRRPEGAPMSWIDWLSAAAALGLFVYLGVALINAEDF